MIGTDLKVVSPAQTEVLGPDDRVDRILEFEQSPVLFITFQRLDATRGSITSVRVMPAK